MKYGFNWIYNFVLGRESDTRAIQVGIVIIIALTVDMMSSVFYDVLKDKLSSMGGLLVFIVIVGVLYGIGSNFLLNFAKGVLTNLKMKSTLYSVTYKLVRIIQYGLGIIFLIMILQMIFVAQYNRGLIVLTTAIGTLPASVLLGLLAYNLLSWYRSNKRNFMVLLLGLSAATGAIGAAGNLFFVDSLSLEKPTNIGSDIQINLHEFGPSSFGSMAQLVYSTTIFPLFMSFLFEWGGIVLLLSHFSKKIGRIKYFVIVCLPLGSFLGGIIPTLIVSPSPHFSFYDPQMFLFRVFATVGAYGGAIMMGFAYLIVARNVRRINRNTAVTNYMMLSALGVVMLSTSFQSPEFLAAYPPFGALARCFLSIASYVFSLGFYSSAISVSEDVKLRQSIRKFAMDESKLLDSIGTAHMEQKIQKKVMNLVKEYSGAMTKETGIQPSLSEEDVNQYLSQVIEEIKINKKNMASKK